MGRERERERTEGAATSNRELSSAYMPYLPRLLANHLAAKESLGRHGCSPAEPM